MRSPLSRSAAAGLAVLLVASGGVVLSATAAHADPSPGSALSALTVTGTYMTPLAPSFAAGTRSYQVVTTDSPTADVTPTAADSGATVVVAEGGTTIPINAGVASAPLVRGRNDISITVTSTNPASTTAYRVTVWRNVAPTPTVSAIGSIVTPPQGGAYFSVKLADGALPDDCSRSIQVQGAQRGVNDNVFDPATGLTDMQAVTPELSNATAGRTDLVIVTGCSPPHGGFTSTVTVPNAVTVLDGISITGSDIPATISAGSVLRIRGPGISYDTSIDAWLQDADGTQYSLRRWGFTGTDQTEWYVEYDYEEDFYMHDRPVTFNVGHYDYGLGRYVADYTRPTAFTPPTPSQLSFSPAAGPVAGGSQFLLRGRFMYSGVEYLTIRVGGRTASYRYISSASYSEDYNDYQNALDVLRVTVPAGVAPGLVPVTVETEYGTGTAAAMFRYVPRPRVDAIAPGAVANSGGAVITLTGAGFGASGTPSVVVGSTKSPLVNRLSDTQVTAVVPASTDTGVVPVTVSSGQGGGVSAASGLTLAAPGSPPAITGITPAGAMPGDTVRITGSNLGTAGTVGVAFGDTWAFPAAVSPTSITVTVPDAGLPGARTVMVGTPGGTGTAPNPFQLLAQPGITTVSPAVVRSDAVGVAAQIALTGAGFGTTGVLRVGAAPPVAYTATAGGTLISGVVVPRTTAGALPIVLTPRGSRTSLRGSVRVTGPVIAYVGPDPFAFAYAPSTPAAVDALTYQVSTAGGSRALIQGTGLGTAGVLSVDGRPVSTTSWSDTAITFLAPARRTAGPVTVTVTPAGSPIAASRPDALRYIPAVTGLPSIGAIASVADNGYPSRTEFNQAADASDQFTLTGQNLAGTSAAATRVVISDGNQTFTLVPTGVTGTSLTFGAPRSFTATGDWKTVRVLTNAGAFLVEHGVFYRSDGIEVGINPGSGYCGRTALTASGAVTYQPATASITANSAAFGDAGTVTVDGVVLGTTGWTDRQIGVDFAQLATALSQPWGTKTLVITPTDTTVPPRRVAFVCGVAPAVTTTINSSTSPVTVPAGTAVTVGNTSAGFVDAFTVTPTTGYEYVTDANYQSTGFAQSVRPGVPSAAGDYWVRVALPRANYDRTKYLSVSVAPAHLIITGRPVTVTAVSDLGASTVYRGQLNAPGDFHYTATSTPDPITKVYYEHRNALCAGQGPDAGWSDGLPGDVAIASYACGGDGVSHSTWQVRVKSIEMMVGGVDRSDYYLATFPVATIDITPKPLTITGLRADKIWDGTDTAPLGTPAVSGVVGDDQVTLTAHASGQFADASVGVNRMVTLSQDVTLDGSAATDYTLTNPRPSVVGTISKAPAQLALAASTRTVLLSQTPTVTITPTVTDARTGNPPDGSANVAPVVLVSQTPSICTISDVTVTAIAAGTCVIAGTEATSANYLAATAVSDPTSSVETVEIQVFAAQQAISVLADDLTVADGDTIDPSAQVSGLFDGDTLDGVNYDYYDGGTLLTGAPTAVGTYRIVPKDGTLHAADDAVYSNPSAFTYVAGKLIITPAPPTISGMTPRSGMITGGDQVTVAGTRLDTVRSLMIGAVTLSGADLAVNDDGTALTFTVPAVRVAGPVDVVLTAGTATARDVYVYLATPPWVPRDPDVNGSGTSITVRFTVPASDGGSAISGYQFSVDSGRTWVDRPVSCRAAQCAVILTGLTTARLYPVRVRAVNDVGPGPSTDAENAYTNPVWNPVIPTAPNPIPVPANPERYQGPRRYTRAFYTTYSGRPAAPISTLGAHQLVSGEAVTTLRGELFDFDSAKLTAAGRAAVLTVAQHLRLADRVTCEGYTDYAGEANHERQLSLARAQVICRTLIADGAQITTAAAGYGGARPVVVGGTAQSRAENRRVVIRVDA